MFTRKLSFTKPTYPKARALGITEFPYIERDSKGFGTYREEEDESWARAERDSNGNEIYFESSEGYWEKWEYDSKANRTYYENSDGEIIRY